MHDCSALTARHPSCSPLTAPQLHSVLTDFHSSSSAPSATQLLSVLTRHHSSCSALAVPQLHSVPHAPPFLLFSLLLLNGPPFVLFCSHCYSTRSFLTDYPLADGVEPELALLTKLASEDGRKKEDPISYDPTGGTGLFFHCHSAICTPKPLILTTIDRQKPATGSPETTPFGLLAEEGGEGSGWVP
jgi:hypothetical protein